MMGFARSLEHPGEPTIVCRQDAQPALLSHLRVPVAELELGLGGALERLIEQLRLEGSMLCGAPFLAFHTLSAEGADLELGIPVQDAAHGGGGTYAGTIPAGRYLTFAHLKRERPLSEEFRAMQAWLANHAERTSGPLYAVLLAQPGSKELVILIQRRISAGGAAAEDPYAHEHALSDALWGRIAAAIEALAELSARAALQIAVPSERPPHWEQPRSSWPPRSSWTGRSGAPLLVQDAMSPAVVSCVRGDSAQHAARLMWEHDVGALPVLEAGRPVAMVTDRDLCMAAYLQGKKLEDIDVASAMSRHLYVCRLGDPVRFAEHKMALHQVRRLPVVDGHGQLVGMLSMNDIVLARASPSEPSPVGEDSADIAATLAAICQHRWRGPGTARPSR